MTLFATRGGGGGGRHPHGGHWVSGRQSGAETWRVLTTLLRMRSTILAVWRGNLEKARRWNVFRGAGHSSKHSILAHNLVFTPHSRECQLSSLKSEARIQRVVEASAQQNVVYQKGPSSYCCAESEGLCLQHRANGTIPRNCATERPCSIFDPKHNSCGDLLTHRQQTYQQSKSILHDPSIHEDLAHLCRDT